MKKRVGLIVVSLALVLTAARAEQKSAMKFAAVEPQTLEFIGYYKAIRLTPEQEKIKSDALSPLKAVCCKNFSALTCCCPCNFSKSLWGMSHYLIAKKGYNAAQVQKAAREWIAYVNPNGFSGDVCQTGGCNRPFAQNGCGGMDDTAVRF